jgi:hypothetical protein
MLTIIAKNMKLEREQNDVMSATPSMRAVHFRFADGTELSVFVGDIPPEMAPQINMVQSAKAPNITIDFTKPKQLVSFV